jgi:hypothetical protein
LIYHTLSFSSPPRSCLGSESIAMSQQAFVFL